MEGTGKSDLAVSTIKEACRQKFPGAHVDSPPDDFTEWRWYEHPCGRYGIKMLAVELDSSVEWGWRVEIAEQEVEHFRHPDRHRLNIWLTARDESDFFIGAEASYMDLPDDSRQIAAQQVASRSLSLIDARRVATWKLTMGLGKTYEDREDTDDPVVELDALLDVDPDWIEVTCE